MRKTTVVGIWFEGRAQGTPLRQRPTANICEIGYYEEGEPLREGDIVRIADDNRAYLVPSCKCRGELFVADDGREYWTGVVI